MPGATGTTSLPTRCRCRPRRCDALVIAVSPGAVPSWRERPAEVARSGAEPRSLTERRDAVVEQAFNRDGVDGLKAAYDAYGGLIHRFCSRTLGPDAAGDATQEVFVAAWRDRDRFDPTRGPLIGWLMGIARNKVKGVARDTGRHPCRSRPSSRPRPPTRSTPSPIASWWRGPCGPCLSGLRPSCAWPTSVAAATRRSPTTSACRWAPSRATSAGASSACAADLGAIDG